MPKYLSWRPRESKRQASRVRSLLSMVVVALLGIAILFWSSRPKKVALAPHAEETPIIEVKPALAAMAPSPGAPTKPSVVAPEPPPVIDEILLEKPEVCSGEENLITVRAHTVNETNEFLHAVVDGIPGTSVPLRLTLGENGNIVGQHSVTVFGRGNSATTLPLPRYRVKDCQPSHILLIEQRLRANTNSDFDFHARIVTLPPRSHRTNSPVEPFHPASFTWTFGDGQSEVTAGPVTTHSYEGRGQDALYSYFTVGVEARDPTGHKLLGRVTIPLINPAFEAFALKGMVQILISLEPRFPMLNADGQVVQKVRLWHTRPESVTIQRALETEYYESGAGQREPRGLDPGQLLGTTTIPPGKTGIETTVVLDTEAKPEVFCLTYQLVGKSRDGHPALGSFSVMKPPPRPTRDNSDPVMDPNLEAKIRTAREILHQDVVTDDDLWRLQREGDLRTSRRPRKANTRQPPRLRQQCQHPITLRWGRPYQLRSRAHPSCRQRIRRARHRNDGTTRDGAAVRRRSGNGHEPSLAFQ